MDIKLVVKICYDNELSKYKTNYFILIIILLYLLKGKSIFLLKKYVYICVSIIFDKTIK